MQKNSVLDLSQGFIRFIASVTTAVRLQTAESPEFSLRTND
jgi:hypothetical protein